MRSFAMGALVVACAAAMGRAAVVFDAHGFEPPLYEEGKLAGQNGWVQRNNTSTTAEVQRDFVQSGSQALRLRSAIGQNEFFPNLNFVPTMGDVVVVECDIARTASSTPSFGYFIDVYGSDGQRVARAGLGRDGTNIRAVRTLPTGTAPANSIVYAPMQWVHFEMQLNFANHTWAMLIDGVPSGSGLPMINVFAPGIMSADLQVSSFLASTDTGWFDNYVVRTVPAPGAIVLVAIGVLVAARRKR